MKKILIILFLVIGYLIIGFSVKAEEIKNFDTKIIINKDGTINITEQIEYDFGALQRHGIYRTITYITRNKEGKKFKLDINSFSVKDEKGINYKYSRSSEGDDIKLKIGDPNKTISGVHTYVIDYQVAGALTYFSDHDELYWNIIGDDWTVPIISSTASVELPAEISQENIKVVCYTGSTGATDSTCQVAQRGNRTTFTTTKMLNLYEGMTIAVSFPIDIVAHLEPKEVISFGQTFIGKLVVLIIGLLVFFWYVFYPLQIIYNWWRYGRDPQGQVKQVRAWFDPPKTKEGRDLTPAEVGGLIDETVQIRDISSAIVDLARRGYLKIEERKKNDFYFVRRSLDEGVLLPYEKKLLEGLFLTSDTTRIKDRHLAGTVTEIESLVYQQLVDNGLFPKNPNSVRTFYSVIGVLALITGNLPLALIAFTFGRAMPAKTIFGVESANIAKSLKNFLTSQERQLKFQADKQMMFEKLLPFAVAFGVEKIWAERFKNITLKQPEWYSSYSSTRAFNSSVFASSLNSSMSSFRSAATPVSSTTGHSSGFGGGGFSGGGGGGGGGGSW